MGLKTMLNDEIVSEFEQLKKMGLGTEEYKTTVDGLTKLVDRQIEIDKLESEQRERAEARDEENEFKLKQAADEKKDKIVKNVLQAIGIIAPIGLTVWGTVTMLKFEEEGTVTTAIGRGFINKLLPKK